MGMLLQHGYIHTLQVVLISISITVHSLSMLTDCAMSFLFYMFSIFTDVWCCNSCVVWLGDGHVMKGNGKCSHFSWVVMNAVNGLPDLFPRMRLKRITKEQMGLHRHQLNFWFSGILWAQIFYLNMDDVEPVLYYKNSMWISNSKNKALCI